MELIFQQQTIFSDHPMVPEEIIEKINELLGQGHYFSHFIADGTEVFMEHEEYLKCHANTITRLEIIAKTVKEFINDLLLSTEEYIERAIPEMESLAVEFYEHPQPDTWVRLEQLLGGVQWIDEMLMVIGRSDAVPNNWEDYLAISSKIQEEVRDLSEAIENEDNILIGDIVQYELSPQFEALGAAVKLTIDNEGMRHDIN